MYPPIDPDFYSIGAASGMSDDEIKQDWEAYCDDLQKFHADIDKLTPEAKQSMANELDSIQKELDAAPFPVQQGMQPLIDELKGLFKGPTQ